MKEKKMEFSSMLPLYSLFVLATTSPSTRISGGIPVSIDSFPSAAAILEFTESSNQYEQVCGGAILTSYYILTAAQCLSNNRLQVRVGTSSRTTGGVVLDVIEAVPHPDFETMGADIAVLGLAEPIVFNTTSVGRAPLPFQDMESNVGMTAFVVGWDTSETSGPSSDDLKYGILYISNHQQCVATHASQPNPISVNDLHICAFNIGVDFCTGSRGSPLYSSGVLVGVASRTIDCGVTSIPSVYSHVSRYTNWILSIATGIPSK